MKWYDRVLAKRDDVIPSFVNVDAINSYVDKSMQLDQPEMTGTETAADIALGFAPGIGTAMGFRDFERARRDDDKLGMGLGLLSMIPVAGGAVKAGRKGVNRIIDELDMSHAARMERARDMGFDTDNVVYRGIGRDYDPDKAGNYQMFTSSPLDASEYAGKYRAGNVVPAMVRPGKTVRIDGKGSNFNSIPISDIPDDIASRLHPSVLERGLARTDDLSYAAKDAGYDSIVFDDIYDNASNEIRPTAIPTRQDDSQSKFAEFRDILEELGVDVDSVQSGYSPILPESQPVHTGTVSVSSVFDPSNIRSVNAAFDPAKKDSANLLAGLGALGLGVGGATSMLAPQPANASDEPWYERVLKK